mmetsp:Transcript_11134/g.30334  ORF Transcript_11134/g.30334 Transcript_11134/m.30334 type:complete len:241 (+) Transcript_11134:543-1265(+)
MDLRGRHGQRAHSGALLQRDVGRQPLSAREGAAVRAPGPRGGLHPGPGLLLRHLPRRVQVHVHRPAAHRGQRPHGRRPGEGVQPPGLGRRPRRGGDLRGPGHTGPARDPPGAPHLHRVLLRQRDALRRPARHRVPDGPAREGGRGHLRAPRRGRRPGGRARRRAAHVALPAGRLAAHRADGARLRAPAGGRAPPADRLRRPGADPASSGPSPVRAGCGSDQPAGWLATVRARGLSGEGLG